MAKTRKVDIFMNYHVEMENIINSLTNTKPKLLLHSCCSVCSSHVLSVLSQYFNVTINFYNPNIHPKQEFDKRFNDLTSFIDKAHSGKIKIAEPSYNSQEFYTATQGLYNEPEGAKRCEKCFNLRLMQTASLAKKDKYDFFSTTLTVSPHKNATIINEVGKMAQKMHNVQFLPADFKKKDGYKHSVQLANIYNLYRQNYCGCEFSVRK